MEIFKLVVDSGHLDIDNPKSNFKALIYRDENGTESSLENSSLINVYNCVRDQLLEKKINQEAVLIYLSLDSCDILLYLPIILAIISTNNAFFFVPHSDDIDTELREIGSRVLITTSGKCSECVEDKIKVTFNENKERKGLPSEVVYIIRTSGTTGASKTVHVTNSSVVTNIRDLLNHWHVSPRDQVLMSSPPTFDPHILDLMVSYISGAMCVIMPRRVLQTRVRVNVGDVTVLHCTPSLLMRLDPPKSLRLVAVGGEKCSFEVKSKLKKLFNSGVEVFHMYGLTEMSVWQSMVKCDSNELLDMMPIMIRDKNLLRETQLKLVDNQIVISSHTRGCFFKKSLQSEMLLLKEVETGDLADWSEINQNFLIWRVRNDDVVKIFGKKVCLNEVGDVLSKELDTNVVCLGINDTLNADNIGVCAFVQNNKRRLSEYDVYKTAKRCLTAHKVPAKVIIMDDLPVTSHGKFDKFQLKGIACSKQDDLSLDDKKKHLHQAWKSIIGTPPDNNDNFVSCGGDSFSALALVNMLRFNHPFLMEIVLTGTYQEILHLITTNNSESKGTKRKPTPFANTWNQNTKKMKKSPLKVTCKSRGRVYGLPQSTKINNKSTNIKLEQKWKVDLRKCIDSSPLLLFSGNRSLIVSCSHAGRVVAGIVWCF